MTLCTHLFGTPLWLSRPAGNMTAAACIASAGSARSKRSDMTPARYRAVSVPLAGAPHACGSIGRAIQSSRAQTSTSAKSNAFTRLGLMEAAIRQRQEITGTRVRAQQLTELARRSWWTGEARRAAGLQTGTQERQTWLLTAAYAANSCEGHFVLTNCAAAWAGLQQQCCQHVPSLRGGVGPMGHPLT